MGFHTYPLERADALEDPSRYRYCSREELVAAVGRDTSATVLDLGVGTGFFARDVAPFVDVVVGLDVQPAMLDLLADRDSPENLQGIVGAVESLPIGDGVVDVAFSTMTYHEYATPAANREVRRTLDGDGRLVTFDWTREGAGESGPPLEERYDLTTAVEQLQAAGFRVRRTEARPETFLLVAGA